MDEYKKKWVSNNEDEMKAIRWSERSNLFSKKEREREKQPLMTIMMVHFLRRLPAW